MSADGTPEGNSFGISVNSGGVWSSNSLSHNTPSDEAHEMTHDELLDVIVEQGIDAARQDYNGRKLDGAVAGFNACRGKSPQELKELLDICAISTRSAMREHSSEYWWYRCYQAEVEWVCNCISVALMGQGCPVIVTPTISAAIFVGNILG